MSYQVYPIYDGIEVQRDNKSFIVREDRKPLLKIWFPNTDEMTAELRAHFSEANPFVTFFSAGPGRKGAQINPRRKLSCTHLIGEDGRLITAEEIDARIANADDVVYYPGFAEAERMKG